MVFLEFLVGALGVLVGILGIFVGVWHLYDIWDGVFFLNVVFGYLR